MNNKLSKVNVIDSLKLKSDSYFQSLFELARESGVLCESDGESIQQQFMCLAYDLSSSLAGGNSSIGVDIFEGLLKSILYCFSLALKEYESPDEAAKALKNESMESLYYAGKSKLLNMLYEIKKNRSIIKACKFKTNNYFFNNTQDEVLKDFFEKYDCITGADTNEWIFSYPTYNFIEPLKGAEYIHRKQEATALESRFLSAFKNEKIHQLMNRAYIKNNDESYEDAVINIYQYVLCQALGCEILLKDAAELYITNEEICDLKRLILSLEYGSLVQTLNDSLGRLYEHLNIDDKALSYAEKSIPQLANELLISGGQNIKHLFAFDNPNDKQRVYDGESLTDEDFTYIVSLLNRTDSDIKKAQIISENIDCLNDFEEIVHTCNINESVLLLCFEKIKKELLVLTVYKYTLHGGGSDDVITRAVSDFVSSLDSQSKAQLDKIISSIYF